jgi:hypothetical protein
MSESGEFRPERSLVIAYSSLCGFMVALGIWFAAVTAQHGWLGSLLLGVAVIPLSAWTMVRVFLVRISFDADTLHIVGPFWSRRIPRTDLLALDQSDLDLPTVTWTTHGSATRETRLFAVGLPWGISFTTAMSARRRRFLLRLDRWMHDSHVARQAP